MVDQTSRGRAVKILLIEDDAETAYYISQGLTGDGHHVDMEANGAVGLRRAVTDAWDLLIIDRMLPQLDGVSIVHTLRQRALTMPVLLLTTLGGVDDRVDGLNAGADDYLVKPFALDELAARIRALLRRQSGRADPLITYGDLTLNPATHQVLWRGQDVALSGREFAVLQALLERPGTVLSRTQLEERLYGWEEEVTSNAVEVHIHHLRHKLDPALIRTVRGVGYMVPKLV